MRKKQGLLIIADGLGDRPIARLNHKTPLEAALTPNLDQLAAMGMTGNVYPIAPGKPVGTDVGHLHIFGYDSAVTYSGRGPLEAFSGGLDLMDGDVAFRGNFATIDEAGIVIDRRAGRIRTGTASLADALTGMVLSDGTTVLVKELTEHRVAVVLRGRGLSDRVSDADPGTAHEGELLPRPQGTDGSAEAARTAELLWEFLTRATPVLNDHPVNQVRLVQGLLPANVILTRGSGQKMAFQTLKERNGIKGACIGGDLTVLGIAGIVGMSVFTDDSFTGSFDTNLKGKSDWAIELVHQGYDWVVVHIKATDLAGHDNAPEKKIGMIEAIDAMMGDLMRAVDLEQCLISFTADHSTPCEVRDHSGDGVPTIIAGTGCRRDGISSCSEKDFVRGSLSGLTANDIFNLQMDLMGFSRKIGS